MPTYRPRACLVRLGVGAAVMTALTVPHATAMCFFDGERRPDIADKDCLEAQKSGCVRSMLTPPAYVACLRDFRVKRTAGEICVINGRTRSEFNKTDCAEAKATGCVRRFLTDVDYRKCINHFQ